MSFALLSLTVGLLGLYLLQYVLRKGNEQLPPGPPRKPIIGNLGDLPSHNDRAWEHWLKHKELYGPISSVTVWGEHIIVLNDARLAVELLEKRSSIHSSRPNQTFGDMAGWNNILGSVKYSDAFRAIRKALHQQIGSNVSVAQFNPVQEVEVRRFLLRVLRDPRNLLDHIRKEAGAIVLKVAYGYTIEPHGPDPLVDLANKAMEEFSVAILPGTWAVDFFPLLRYIPTWFPGVEFPKMAKKFKKTVTAFSDLPYAFVKQKMAENNFQPSFLSNLLQETSFDEGSEEEMVVKWSAASLYAGGADTTVSTMASFFLSMAMNPEVQEKAQAEIDRIVGVDRLPGYEDRDNLPYINAMVKEVFRWHPVVPTSVAHTSIKDDTCEGYHIPKGSAIIPNIWAYTHDPEVYPDPLAFKPERFLEYDGHVPERDPHLLSFGFGRRVCPGRTLADSNVYLSLAQSLAVFRITKPVRDGKVIEPEPMFQPGIISHPAPFEVDVKPRSPGHVELILAVEKEQPWEKSHAKELSSSG